jgi:hypothetical protein
LRIAKGHFSPFGTDIAYEVRGNCALRINGAAAIWGLAEKTRKVLVFSDVLIFGRKRTVNAANDYVAEQDLDYQIKFRRPEPNKPGRPRRPEHTRLSRPTGFNGMHRRRNKRYG